MKSKIKWELNKKIMAMGDHILLSHDSQGSTNIWSLERIGLSLIKIWDKLIKIILKYSH